MGKKKMTSKAASRIQSIKKNIPVLDKEYYCYDIKFIFS